MTDLRQKTREYYAKIKGCRTFADFQAAGIKGMDDPLCAEYYEGTMEAGMCAGCPIRIITGQIGCYSTVAGMMFKRIGEMRDYGIVLSAPLEEVESMANLAEMAFDFAENGWL